MSQTYKFHFSFDVNKQPNYFPALINLSVKFQENYFDIPIYKSNQFIYKQQLLGPGLVNWHIGSITTPNIDLLAFIYQYLRLLPPPIIFGFDIDTLKRYCINEISNPELIKMSENLSLLLGNDKDVKEYIMNRIVRKPDFDKKKIEEIISSNGYLKNSVISRKTKDYFVIQKGISENIKNNNFCELRKLFVELTDNILTEDNYKENLYIKRITSTRIIAADILPLRVKSKNSDLITENYTEYINCIDEILSKDNGEKESELRRLIDEYVPTIESLAEPNTHKLYSYINGQIKNHLDNPRSEIGSFYRHPKTDIICYCNKGIIFKFFPDPIHASRYTDEPVIDKCYLKLWTTLKPSVFQSQLDKGYRLFSVDTYKHKNWRFSKREPDFTLVNNSYEIVLNTLQGKNIIYTGRSHNINGDEYFEIDLIRYKKLNVIGNVIRDNINKLFWNAENILRTNHNLPKIGEGWLSEMRMFELILNTYPNSLHHYSPDWLRPQHFDVYIPDLKIAFEYQGKQHYEPVDFFGAEESYLENIKRDKMKLEKSKKNKVKVVYWKYDEPLHYDTMKKKINNALKLA